MIRNKSRDQRVRDVLVRRRIVTSKKKLQELIAKKVVTSSVLKKTKKKPRVAPIPFVTGTIKKKGGIRLKEFVPTDSYKFSRAKPINVLHFIESLGLGGGQIMLMELFNGLKRYYGNETNNFFCSPKQKVNDDLYSSYGVDPAFCAIEDLRDYCNQQNIDILFHHRISMSNSLHNQIPKDVKYVLINHTWNAIDKVATFQNCDCYVSVCQFLQRSTQWGAIHDSRKVTILNGIENDYIKDIEPAELEGDFITGRCHRLVGAKFKMESIPWLARSVNIPGFSHYILGFHKELKQSASKYDNIHYVGPVNDRTKKMSYIKAFDVYFYETFSHEGASIAVLEALACGVPVIARPFGGNAEMITNGFNGFLVGDRDQYGERMKQLAGNRELLVTMKKQALKDFDARLHVRHTACKYVQLSESLLGT